MLGDFFLHVRQHLMLAGSALVCGGFMGVIAGMTAYEVPRAASIVTRSVTILRVVPSLAVLMLLVPWLGLGDQPAIVALSLLAAAPIALAVEAGLRSLPQEILEIGRAMGMDTTTLRRKVLWPHAVPIAFGGFRTAAVEALASATLAAFVGAGGLGEYVVEGLATGDTGKLLEGGVSIAVLVWCSELLLAFAQRRLLHSL